jgi:hypothetical protein
MDGLPGAGRFARIAARSLAGALVFGIPIAAQSPGVPVPQPGIDHGQSSSRFPSQQSPFDLNGDPEMEAKRIKAINQMRHKAMVDDAAKLLSLAKELNDESADLSGAERVRKATEIEKLAKSVKDKMIYSVGGEVRPPVYPVTAP